MSPKISPLKKAFAKGTKGLFDLAFGSSWDAANYSPKRAQTPGAAPSDFSMDLTTQTREELVKGSRYIMRNSGLPREHRELYWLYGVGPEGLKMQATTQDDEWNEAAEQYFKKWSKRADVTERFDWAYIQKLVSYAIDTDGEIFVVKTRSRRTREPRLQLIETHRVCNKDMRSAPESEQNEKWIDGIRVDHQTGKPIALGVKDEAGYVKTVRWNSVIQVAEMESASAYRAIPTLSHSINHFLDESEILAQEKANVKAAGDVINVLKRKSGALEEGTDYDPFGANDLDENGEMSSDPKALANITGQKTLAIYDDEEYQSIESNRPNNTFNGFIDLLREDSLLGGTPGALAIGGKSLSGATNRLMVAKAERKFKSRTRTIANFAEAVWFFVIGDAIDRGELAAVKGWSNISVTPPRSLTVDSGRESEANRRDVDAGIKLVSDSYEEQGGDFMDAMRKKARLIKQVRELAEGEGIDPKTLFNFDSEKTIAQESGGNDEAPKNSESGGAPSGSPAQG